MRRQEQHPLEELQRQLTVVAEGGPRRRTKWWLTIAAYAAVAVAASLAALLVAHRFPGGSPRPASGIQAAPAEYLATLVRLSDCVWEPGQPARFAGMRLSAGEFRLVAGLIEVAFDNGPVLIVEGPAQLRIESRALAVLSLGKAVLKSDETAESFTLRTPWSTLLDVGTEYAVSVEHMGEELQRVRGTCSPPGARVGAWNATPGAIAGRLGTPIPGPGRGPVNSTRSGPLRPRHSRSQARTLRGSIGIIVVRGIRLSTGDAVTSDVGYDGRPWNGPWRQPRPPR